MLKRRFPFLIIPFALLIASLLGGCTNDCDLDKDGLTDTAYPLDDEFYRDHCLGADCCGTGAIGLSCHIFERCEAAGYFDDEPIGEAEFAAYCADAGFDYYGTTCELGDDETPTSTETACPYELTGTWTAYVINTFGDAGFSCENTEPVTFTLGFGGVGDGNKNLGWFNGDATFSTTIYTPDTFEYSDKGYWGAKGTINSSEQVVITLYEGIDGDEVASMTGSISSGILSLEMVGDPIVGMCEADMEYPELDFILDSINPDPDAVNYYGSEITGCPEPTPFPPDMVMPFDSMDLNWMITRYQEITSLGTVAAQHSALDSLIVGELTTRLGTHGLDVTMWKWSVDYFGHRAIDRIRSHPGMRHALDRIVRDWQQGQLDFMVACGRFYEVLTKVGPIEN